MFYLSEQALAKLDTPTLTAILRASAGVEPRAEVAGEQPAAILRGSVGIEAAEALLPVIAGQPEVDLALVAAFLDALALAQAERVDALVARLRDLVGGTSMLTGCWLLAELEQERGNERAALELWEKIVTAGGGGQMAEALLALGRLQLRCTSAPDALNSLRAALRAQDTLRSTAQSFFARAERFYRTLCARLEKANTVGATDASGNGSKAVTAGGADRRNASGSTAIAGKTARPDNVAAVGNKVNDARELTDAGEATAVGGACGAGQVLRIAILGSGTTTFLATALKMVCVRDGFAPEIYEAPYGAFRQEIMNAQSGLYAFAPQFVVIATQGRDAHLPAFAAEGEAEALVESTLSEWLELWALLLSRLPCTVLQNNFDLDWSDSAGSLGFVEPEGRPRLLLALNEGMRQRAPAGVVVVEADMASALVGKIRWSNARQWFMSGQHPAQECLPLLADVYCSLIRAALGMAKKVLVLDLDNTLWGGVIGEDGVDGIRLGAPSAEGEAFVAFQRYALELKGRGVLLAVCSKNNEADARQPFLEHEAMVLGLDDFVAFHATWGDKPSALQALAKALNLGLESFVFVDDNPAERALVRYRLPQVAVPEMDSADPAGYIAAIEHGRYFEALALSMEDRQRHGAYRANAERARLLAATADMESFLRQLEMKVTHGVFDSRVFERVVQLLGKTNQFNLTTRRHSREQVTKFMANPEVWTQWFRLQDRFGDNGLVGLLIAVPAGEQTWEIDTFLMSCRVIGRDMEKYMMATLLHEAGRRGIRRVMGRYVPTTKNAMVSDLYPQLGFVREEGADPGVFVYSAMDNLHPVPPCFAQGES